MEGYYTKFQDRSGQYRFNLKAANHEIILHSESYTTSQGRDNGIESVKINSGIEARYQRLVAKDTSPYFVLKASNGQVIGVSETYSSSSARDRGIEACKRIGPKAKVK